MEEVFINKVANSGIETINLETYFPVGERVSIDVKELLFRKMHSIPWKLKITKIKKS